MPIYSFFCDKCDMEIEEIYKISDRPDDTVCPVCNGRAKRVLMPGRGGIRLDSKVSWLPSAVKVLQPNYERPIETRSEYDKYLKDRNIIPVG